MTPTCRCLVFETNTETDRTAGRGGACHPPAARQERGGELSERFHRRGYGVRKFEFANTYTTPRLHLAPPDLRVWLSGGSLATVPGRNDPGGSPPRRRRRAESTRPPCPTIGNARQISQLDPRYKITRPQSQSTKTQGGRCSAGAGTAAGAGTTCTGPGPCAGFGPGAGTVVAGAGGGGGGPVVQRTNLDREVPPVARIV